MFYNIYLLSEPIDFKYFRKMSANLGDKEGPGRKASDCWEIAFGSSRALAIVKAEKQTACTHCALLWATTRRVKPWQHTWRSAGYTRTPKQNEISPLSCKFQCNESWKMTIFQGLLFLSWKARTRSCPQVASHVLLQFRQTHDGGVRPRK